MDPFNRFFGLDADLTADDAIAALSRDWACDDADADDHVASDEE